MHYYPELDVVNVVTFCSFYAMVIMTVAVQSQYILYETDLQLWPLTTI